MLQVNRWDPKDPSDVEVFVIDFSERLATGATIAAHELTVPSGLTMSNDSHTNTQVSFTLADGVADTEYEVRCKITTSQGDIIYATVLLRVETL